MKRLRALNMAAAAAAAGRGGGVFFVVHLMRVRGETCTSSVGCCVRLGWGGRCVRGRVVAWSGGLAVGGRAVEVKLSQAVNFLSRSTQPVRRHAASTDRGNNGGCWLVSISNPPRR